MALVLYMTVHPQNFIGFHQPRKGDRIPIYRAHFVDTGKNYRGRLGAKDKARRERALSVA